MSFKGLYEYVDYLAKLYEENSGTFSTISQFKILELLTNYYGTALSSARFVTQREYCKGVIYKLNPNYAKGYFESKKKKIK